MKKTLSLLAALMVAGVATTPVQAATHYVSAFGGISWMQDMDATNDYQNSAPNTDYSAKVELGSGVALTGAVGCDYGHYRLEAEVGYQKNDIKSAIDYYGGIPEPYVNNADGGESTVYPMRGDVSVLSLMGNAYYDFDLGSKVELYATAGIGVAQVSFKNVNDTGTWNYVAPGYEFEADNDPGYSVHATTLAWQVGAGISAPIADNVKVDLRYRYFATADFTLDDSANYFSDADNMSLSSHSVLLGLRVDF